MARIQKYPASMRAIHWLMALLVIGMLCVGLWMTELSSDVPYRMDVYNLHKSIGALLLLLIGLRILNRLRSNVPPLPRTIKPLHRFAAHTGHALLYLLMLAMPITGYAMSDAFGYGVKFFGVPLPKIFPTDKALGGLAHEAHEWLAFALIAVLVAHVAGVIKHRFFDQKAHDVLPRML